MTSHKVPDFLIIGAMKAGTTTLYRDLVQHPEIFLPQEKEPETLVRFGDDDQAMRADYQSLFRPASGSLILGEASTAYAKRPDHEGVAERALRICGPKLRIIYLTREPIGRIVSQFRHEQALGLVSGPLNEAVLAHGRFVAYSRYDWQLAPWIDAFGASNVLRLEFEDYVADRQAVVDTVLRFLGAAPRPAGDYSAAYNTAEGKKVARGMWKAVVGSPFYQRQIKPMVPAWLRERAAGMLLTPAQRDDSQLDADTREKLLVALHPQTQTGGTR
jgi:hypothetical protein